MCSGRTNKRQCLGFTLIELMIVILIVGILASVALPLLSKHAERAKWTEANAAAGIIRDAVKVHFSNVGDGADVVGELTDVKDLLGFAGADLNCSNFNIKNFAVTAVNGAGLATVSVDSEDTALTGSAIMGSDGAWTYTPPL